MDHAPTVRARLARMKLRREFLAAARGRKWAAGALVLQARDRGEPESDTARIGFTCSKKVGNAVARNRAKRRLRAAAAAILPDRARPGWDYVLIGRAGGSAATPFADMTRQLEEALRRVHAPGKRRG